MDKYVEWLDETEASGFDQGLNAESTYFSWSLCMTFDHFLQENKSSKYFLFHAFIKRYLRIATTTNYWSFIILLCPVVN